MHKKVNFKAIYRKMYKFAKDGLEEGNCKFIDCLQVDYLQCLLITDVSSDFISKGRNRFTFSNVFWYKSPKAKFCSVIHKTIFHSIIINTIYRFW